MSADRIARLQSALDAVLAPLIAPGQPVVLLDFPLHRNAGDSAILLGERAWLRRRVARLRHTCSISTYNKDLVARRAGPDGVLLLHGGGNFGDLWPPFHRFREQVLADFPDHRVIQLPQSVAFRDPAALRATVAGPIGRHRRLTLLVRDRPSLAIVREALPDVPSHLTPDMAFALGSRTGPEPDAELLWLARDDHERATAAPASGPGLVVTDWDMGRRDELLWRALATLPKAAAALRSSPRAQGPASRVGELPLPRLARMNVEAAYAVLARGRVVVTDRLHAHILSLLLGRPNVVLDNAYGKLSGFLDAWTGDDPLVHAAPDAAAALEIARSLAAGAPPVERAVA